MAATSGEIQAIYRYPVKGLSAEALPRTLLSPRQTVPFDRMRSRTDPPASTRTARRICPSSAS